jgi:SPP1 family predicted phage head-tail adaptor
MPANLSARAELQARVESADGYGGVSVAWQKERSIWCEIKPITGRETIEAMREQSAITHDIRARWSGDLTPDKRITHGGVAYNIRAVMNLDAKSVFVRMLCESGVAT